MEESVVVESLDLSWITITGVDEETTIIRGAIPTAGWVDGIGRSVFLVKNGGFLPIINQLFYMINDSGDPTTNGIVVYKNSRAIINPGCGVRNASYTSIHAEQNSIVIASGAIATGAGVHGIFALYNSIVNATNADVSGCNYDGIRAECNSFINASNVEASNIINNNCSGIYANVGSIINASGANALNCGYAGIRALSGSMINAESANVSGGSYDIRVEYGSIISAINATVSNEGRISPTPNTLTSSGIIFR